MENQPLKQRLKQKRRIVLTNFQKNFSFAYSYVVNKQTPYEICIYVEGGISDHNLKAGWAERISARF